MSMPDAVDARLAVGGAAEEQKEQPKNKPSLGGETPKSDPPVSEADLIKKAFSEAFKR